MFTFVKFTFFTFGRRALFAIAVLVFIVIVWITLLCGRKDKSQRRKNHRNVMMTPINMVEERGKFKYY